MMTDDRSSVDADLDDEEPTLTYELEGDESTSEGVIRAVAMATGSSVLDLDPLYDVIDPAHLDETFGGQDRSRSALNGTVSLQYAGCRVRVMQTEGTRVVHVRPTTDAD